MQHIAVFASGSGSNAENIANYFLNSEKGKVDLILANTDSAYVLERAKKLNIESVVFNRDDFYCSNNVLTILEEHNIDFIVLAGFLWLVPNNIISKYEKRIVNIHPALLPLYGGKGMYGNRVHEAVVANQETESGITIHYVNDRYDEGDIVFQAKCEVTPTDTPEDVAAKVHKLEYRYFPEVIEQIL